MSDKKINLKGKQKVNVYTPDDTISEMFSYVDDSTCFCDPACGTGNILVFIAKQLLKKGVSQQNVIDTLYGYEIDEGSINECIQRISLLLPEVSIDSIKSHIQCLDTLNDNSIQNKKYDTIVMNPPYEKDLHKKFLIWAQKHCNKLVTIQPCQQLYRSPNTNVDKVFMECISKFCKEIKIYNPNLIFENAVFSSPVGIFYIDKSKKESEQIHIKDMMRDDDYYSSTAFLDKYHTELDEFRRKLKSFLRDKKSLQSHISHEAGKEWSVEMPKIRGHLSQTNKDIYSCHDIFTFIPEDRKPEFRSSSKGRLYFNFSSEKEALNFISYLKTFFARACLSTSKHGLHNDCNELAYVPWLDFSKKWTDDELFNLLGDNDNTLYKNVIKVIPRYYED